MKRFLHGVTGFVIGLGVLLAGCAIVYLNGFNTHLRDQIFSKVQESPIIAQIIGVLLILLVLINLVTFGKKRSKKDKKPKMVSYESEGGTVYIEVAAITEFIRKIGEEFGAVVSVDPHVKNAKNLINVDLDTRIQAGTKVPEFSQLIQEKVRESMREKLGVTEVGEIKVNVREIVGSKGS